MKLKENDVVYIEKSESIEYEQTNYIYINGKKKIFLSRGQDISEAGYYQLSNIIKDDMYITANAKKVVYDYYPDIKYFEFLEVLKANGFKIGFIEDYIYEHDKVSTLKAIIQKSSSIKEHLIFAYHLESKICIVAETSNHIRQNSFNFIALYLPCERIPANLVPCYKSKDCSIFNLCKLQTYDMNSGFIHLFIEFAKGQDTSIINEYPLGLYNYAETLSGPEDYFNILSKLKRANRKDMEQLFGNCANIMKALNGKYDPYKKEEDTDEEIWFFANEKYKRRY